MRDYLAAPSAGGSVDVERLDALGAVGEVVAEQRLGLELLYVGRRHAIHRRLCLVEVDLGDPVRRRGAADRMGRGAVRGAVDQGRDRAQVPHQRFGLNAGEKVLRKEFRIGRYKRGRVAERVHLDGPRLVGAVGKLPLPGVRMVVDRRGADGYRGARGPRHCAAEPVADLDVAQAVGGVGQRLHGGGQDRFVDITGGTGIGHGVEVVALVEEGGAECELVPDLGVEVIRAVDLLDERQGTLDVGQPAVEGGLKARVRGRAVGQVRRREGLVAECFHADRPRRDGRLERLRESRRPVGRDVRDQVAGILGVAVGV